MWEQQVTVGAGNSIHAYTPKNWKPGLKQILELKRSKCHYSLQHQAPVNKGVDEEMWCTHHTTLELQLRLASPLMLTYVLHALPLRDPWKAGCFQHMDVMRLSGDCGREEWVYTHTRMHTHFVSFYFLRQGLVKYTDVEFTIADPVASASRALGMQAHPTRSCFLVHFLYRPLDVWLGGWSTATLKSYWLMRKSKISVSAQASIYLRIFLSIVHGAYGLDGLGKLILWGVWGNSSG